MPATQLCPHRREQEDLSWSAGHRESLAPVWRHVPRRARVDKRFCEDYYLRRVKRIAFHSVLADVDTAATVDIGQRFRQLAEEWAAETWHVSSPNDLVAHRAYRQIIELGWDAVPYLLRDLQRTNRFWFPALHEITGVRPFDPKHAGNIRKMAEAWIQWGRKKELI